MNDRGRANAGQSAKTIKRLPGDRCRDGNSVVPLIAGPVRARRRDRPRSPTYWMDHRLPCGYRVLQTRYYGVGSGH